MVEMICWFKLYSPINHEALVYGATLYIGYQYHKSMKLKCIQDTYLQLSISSPILINFCTVFEYPKKKKKKRTMYLEDDNGGDDKFILTL